MDNNAPPRLRDLPPPPSGGLAARPDEHTARRRKGVGWALAAGACLAPAVLFSLVAYSCYAFKQDIDDSWDGAFDDVDLGDGFNWDVEWDGFDISGPGSCETSSEPLVEAAWGADGAAVQRMIDGGSPLEVTDQDGRTPLYCAAYAGNESTAFVLLDAGAPPDVPNDAGDTPLLWAADGGHLGIVDRLLAAGADPSAATHEGHTPLFRAVSRGHVEVTDRLLDAGAGVHATATVTDGEIVHTVNPLDPNAGLMSGLDGDCVTLLAPASTIPGAPPLLPADDPIRSACTVLVRYPGAGNDATALHSAALRGSPDLVVLLLDHGAAIEAPTTGGFTPLQAAALRGDPATVQALLERGADPTPATAVAPPHELARELGHEEAAQLLEAAAAANP